MCGLNLTHSRSKLCLPHTALNLLPREQNPPLSAARATETEPPLLPHRSPRWERLPRTHMCASGSGRAQDAETYTQGHIRMYMGTHINMYMNMHTSMNMDRCVSKSRPTNLSSSKCREIFLYLIRRIYSLVSFPRTLPPPLTKSTGLLQQTHFLGSKSTSPAPTPSQPHAQCVPSSSRKTLPAPKMTATPPLPPALAQGRGTQA